MGQRVAVLTGEYDAAKQAKDWQRAASVAQQLVELNATPKNLLLLGDAQQQCHADNDALATYGRAITQAEAEKPANGAPAAEWNEVLAKLYVSKGNALLRLKQTAEAIAAYHKSTEFAANPAVAYFNICVVLSNSGDMENGIAACQKSVQVDPGRADAWFILGALGFANSKMDAHGNNLISSETRQALGKYLELAPSGPHAADVKAMLDMAVK